MSDSERTEALEGLRALYAEYIAGTEAFFAGRGIKHELMTLLAGGGRYSDCPLHEEFIRRLEAHLSGCAARMAADPPAWRETADAMLEYMLFSARPDTNHPAGWVLVAAESRAGVLLPYAGTDELRSAGERYAKRLRRQGALPVQRELRRRLEQEQRSR